MRHHRRSIVAEQPQQRDDGNVVHRPRAALPARASAGRDATNATTCRANAFACSTARIGRRQQLLLDERVREQIAAKPRYHRSIARATRRPTARATAFGITAPFDAELPVA